MIEKTKGYEKIWTFIERLVDSADFQNWVRKIRKKYDLPISGIKKISYGFTPNGERFVAFPRYLTKSNFGNDVERFSKENGLTLEWSLIIENYVVYNNIRMESKGSMFYMIDLRHYLYGSKSYTYHKDIMDFLEDFTGTHPIAILLSPYANERDIVDYVKKVYRTDIKPALDEYKNKKVLLGKIKRRNKKTKAIEKFIYSNRGFPKKKIMSMVNDKFGKIYDYTYINTIIRNKKRKLGQ